MSLLILFLSILIQSSFSKLTATLIPTTSETTLTLRLQNTDSSAVALLHWSLPFDKRFGGENVFRVFKDYQEVPYIGAIVKYADPSFLDYIVLDVDETISVPVELHNLYDLSEIGNYEVRFEYVLMDLVNEVDFASIPRTKETFSRSKLVVSNTVVLTTTKPALPTRVKVPYPCSNAEYNEILDAADSLVPLITRARQVINTGNSDTYLEWFGAYTNARWNIAEEVIRLIQLNNVVDYACDDMAGVYAYVYPNDATHTIYLCSVFWGINKIGGFDTQSGTLLHELSHFNNIGGTGDHAYGTGACRNLAISNPNNAVNNADSYEYFGESLFPNYSL